MQWNCTSPFLQNPGYDPFSISKAPLYPQIIGEGDVTSIIYPDGSIQLYFVPTHRHDIWSPYQLNANSPNFNCSAKTDIWFVRSISHPSSPSFLNSPFPNVYGDQQPPTQFNPHFFNTPHCPVYNQKVPQRKCRIRQPGIFFLWYRRANERAGHRCTVITAAHELAQHPRTDKSIAGLEFHNDDFTSTTDIHYFYPSLRCKENLKYSTEVQTEPFAINNTNESDRHHNRNICKCEHKKNTNGNASASSTSYMSIDSTSKSKHRLNKKNKKKHKSKTNKRKDHCECLETKRASDKSVVTYAEKASGGIIKGGRHTQTANQKSKRSDIKTELWIPVDCKSRSMLRIDACDSCYSKCSCRSASDTDCY